jgi:PAS domain S-box-containing protein
MAVPQNPPGGPPRGANTHGRGSTAPALLLTLAYGTVSALWIYFSDSLLVKVVSDPVLLGRISTWKGLLFVAVTSLLFFLFARTALTKRQDDIPSFGGEQSETPPPQASGVIPALVFFSLAVLFTGCAYLVFTRYEENSRAVIASRMEAIAHLKARQIENWLVERHHDAQTLTDNPFLGVRIQRWLARGAPDDAGLMRIQELFNNLIKVYGYRGVYLFDQEGRVRVSAGKARGFDPRQTALVRKAIDTNRIELDDIHWEKSAAGQQPDMGLISPFHPGGQGKAVNGSAVYLDIDPARELYPLLQDWPTPSSSAESLIVRRDGNEMVFLNELRHLKGSALKLRFPVDEPHLPVAIALRSKAGLVEGNDYRGVPVVTYIGRVAGTPWLLVAKIDKSEAFAQVQSLLQLVSALALVFIMATGLLIFLWWRQQQTHLQAAWYRTELERRALAVRLDNLTRHANDIILLVDDQMNIVDANDRAFETYGHDREKFLSLTLRDIRAPEAAHDLLEQWQQAGTPEGARFETIHRRSDSRNFPVEVSSRTIQIGGKDFKQSIIRDISDRKLAEEELRLSERNFRALSEQFHTLLDAMPDSIFLLDQDYRIIWANAAVTREFGGVPTGMQGTFCYACRNIRPEPCQDCPASRTFRSSQPDSGIITTRDRRVLDLRTVPLYTTDGRIRGVIEIARDITAHRQTEEQLHHAQKMEAIGTLAGGIAHDFNNLLTSIIGFGSLLQMKIADDDPLKSHVDHIMTAADRAAALTRSLLAYSRKESLELKLLDVNDIVATVERFLSRVIGEDIELTVIPADNPLTILGDRGEIEQVLMNLATNARDSMPGGGSLLIGVKNAEIDESFTSTHGYGSKGRFALITVSDTGSGMDEMVRERIFEPFFTTKELGRGTGLGLAIVYGIVTQHRGFINVTSEPGSGSTFRVYLPLAEGVPGRELPAASLSARGGGETVLLVEDSAEIRQFLRGLLTGSGYRVLEAADGEEAVDMFRENRNTIDLLLLDVIMPRKNGKQAFDEIRTVKPSVKALFMSGYTADVITRKGIDTEGIELIAKPFTPGSLLERIREVLDRDSQL